MAKIIAEKSFKYQKKPRVLFGLFTAIAHFLLLLLVNNLLHESTFTQGSMIFNAVFVGVIFALVFPFLHTGYGYKKFEKALKVFKPKLKKTSMLS